MSCEYHSLIEEFVSIVYSYGQDLDSLSNVCEQYIEKHRSCLKNLNENYLNNIKNLEEDIESEFLDMLGKDPDRVQNNDPYISTVTNSINNVIYKSSEFDLDEQKLLCSFFETIGDKLKSLSVHYTTYRTAILGNVTVSQTQFESLNKSFKKFSKIYKRQQENINKSERNIEKTQDTIDNLLPNLLTVLSILISIVIAVVVVYITIFLEPDNKENSIVEMYIQASFARYVLSVHLLGDLLFLMMFMVARLTNRSILMSCAEFDWASHINNRIKDHYDSPYHKYACADCNKNCTFSKKLRLRSAYIIYFNLIMFALYAALYFWWILDYYVDGEKYFLFTGDFWFVIIFAAVCIVGSVIWEIRKCVKSY